MVPASAGEALGMLESALKVQRVVLEFLADLDTANMPTSMAAECLRGLEQADAVGAAVPPSAPTPAGLTGRAARQAEQAAAVAEALAELEHQILVKILQVLFGPAGVASFLRRNLLGKGLNGPSLPLDVGQP